MKSIARLALVALFSGAALTAHAKTVTSSQGDANDKSVAGVAGPATAAQNSGQPRNLSSKPSKKALRKAKITPPPPMHDPN